jgi:hypothetical protein
MHAMALVRGCSGNNSMHYHDKLFIIAHVASSKKIILHKNPWPFLIVTKSWSLTYEGVLSNVFV